MNWVSKKIDLGEVKVGSNNKVIFTATEKLKKVVSLNASCGCVTPTYDKKTNQVITSFKPGPIPVHLKGKQDFYVSNKSVTVNYADGTSDVLYISAIVKK